MSVSTLVRGLLVFEALLTLISAVWAGLWPASFLAQLGVEGAGAVEAALSALLGSGYLLLALILLVCLRIRDPAGLRGILLAYMLGDLVAAAAFAKLAEQVGWTAGVVSGLGLTVLYFFNRLSAVLRPALVIREEA